MADYNFDEESN